MSLWQLLVFSLVVGLLVNELHNWLPDLAKVLLDCAAGILPCDKRERYTEEWAAEWEKNRRNGRGLYLVVWSASLVPWAAVQRLGVRWGTPVGGSLVVVAVGTTFFAAHDASSASVGGTLLAWGFAAAVVVLACVLFADPRLERPWLLGTGAFLLGLAAAGEALLLRLPSDPITFRVRGSLLLIALGLLAVVVWSLTHGRAKICFFVGIVLVTVGATICGIAECQAGQLLRGSDSFWGASSWLSGVGALLAAATAPLLLNVIYPAETVSS